MPGFGRSRHNVTHNFFTNSNIQTGKKTRVHFKPFAFSKPPILRTVKKFFKKKRKTLRRK